MWWIALATAADWVPDDLQVLDTPSPATDIVAVPGGGGSVLVLDEEGLQLHRSDRVERRQGGGSQLVVGDVDGDGTDEVVRCGPRGVAVVPLLADGIGPATVLDATPCDAVQPIQGASPPAWVAFRAGRARRLTRSSGTTQTTSIDVRLDQPLVARAGDAVVAASRGASHLVQFTATDRAVVHAGGRLTALGSADELLWAVGRPAPNVTLGSQSTPIGAEAQGIAVGDLDGDGVVEVLAWSDEDWLLPAGLDLPVPERLAVSDLDDDGCAELLFVAQGTAAVATGRCRPPAPSDPPEPVAHVPSSDPFPDAVPLVDDGRFPPAEWTQGERIGLDELPPSPDHVDLASASAWEVVPVFVGSDVQLTVSFDGRRWAGRAVGGPPSLEVVHGRILHLQPTERDIGRWPVSLKRTTGGWTGLLIEVWPRPRPGEPLPAVFDPVGPAVAGRGPEGMAAEEPSAREEQGRPWTIRRCGAGAGVATGRVERGPRDGRAGSRSRFSPAVALACELEGLRWLAPWVGVDAAPWFRYYSTPDVRAHVAAASLGLGVGDERLRLGPHGSLGLTTAGLGGRLSAWPSRGPWGVDARATWLVPTRGGQALVVLMRKL